MEIKSLPNARLWLYQLKSPGSWQSQDHFLCRMISETPRMEIAYDRLFFYYERQAWWLGREVVGPPGQLQILVGHAKLSADQFLEKDGASRQVAGQEKLDADHFLSALSKEGREFFPLVVLGIEKAGQLPQAYKLSLL